MLRKAQPRGVFVLLILGITASLPGCSREEEKQAPPVLTQGEKAAVAAAGGVSWVVPAGWTDGGERQMRVATYIVPAADGAAPAECGVFHFGSGQGGDVRANIDRWIAQFENPSKPVEAERSVNGMRITTVTTTGTFLSPSGPMMESGGKKENYMLIGAIVEAPRGSVFFKLTGPSATVQGARPAFDAMVESIH